jgi:hypothetical protein
MRKVKAADRHSDHHYCHQDSSKKTAPMNACPEGNGFARKQLLVDITARLGLDRLISDRACRRDRSLNIWSATIGTSRRKAANFPSTFPALD